MNPARKKELEELRLKAFLADPYVTDLNVRFVKLAAELTELLGRAAWDLNEHDNILTEIDIKCIRLAKVCRMLLGQE